MKCWLKVSTAASWFACCAASFAQQADREKAIEAADRVLSAEEFRPADEPGILERWLQNLGEWLESLFGEAENPFTGMGSVLAPIFMAVAIAALLFLAAWIISLIVARRRSVEPILSFAEERLAPPHELLRLAEAAAAKGDYSRAFTLAYWAFLKNADSVGHLHYSDDATNWEIIATLNRDVPAAVAVEARTHAKLFDEIEYGNGSAEATDYESVLALIDALKKVEVAA